MVDNILVCECRPLSKEINYTGDCPIHQSKMVITMDSLKRSNNPEAKAALNLIEQQVLIGRIDELENTQGDFDGTVMCENGKFWQTKEGRLTTLKAQLKKLDKTTLYDISKQPVNYERKLKEGE